MSKVYWIGGNGLWSAAASWLGGVFPVSGDTVYLTADPTLQAGVNLDGLTITNSVGANYCPLRVSFLGSTTLSASTTILATGTSQSSLG